MADKTLIAWTDRTFNIAWGCTKISPGCKNCYADNLAVRYGHSVWGVNGNRRTFGDKHWSTPHKWESESTIHNPGVRGAGWNHLVFCSSMCDVWEDHPTIDAERAKLWPLIKATPHLDWQLLTKRPERIADHLPSDWSVKNYPNVWLGTSIENDDYTWRAEELKKIPAVVHFISYEPALGPLPSLDTNGLEWLIVGGESGKEWKKHEMDHGWARDIRDKCIASKTAFFFKQSSAALTERGTSLIHEDGTRWFWKQYPNQLDAPVRDVSMPLVKMAA
jgi:protein gp37